MLSCWSLFIVYMMGKLILLFQVASSYDEFGYDLYQESHLDNS